MHFYFVCDERYWNLKLTNFSEKRPKYRVPTVISATGEKVKWVKLNVILTKTEAVLAPGYFSHHLGSGVQEQASCQQSTQQSKRYFLYKNEFIKVHFFNYFSKKLFKSIILWFISLTRWNCWAVLCIYYIHFLYLYSKHLEICYSIMILTLSSWLHPVEVWLLSTLGFNGFFISKVLYSKFEMFPLYDSIEEG